MNNLRKGKIIMFNENYGEYSLPELEDYQEEIMQIIHKAVNGKIKDTVDELASLKDSVAKLRKENSELKLKANRSAIKHADNIKKTIKETEASTARKFSLGVLPYDKVWLIDSKTETLECAKCGGKGHVAMDVLGKDTKVKCPYCSYGKIYKHTYIPKQDMVTSISYEIYSKNGSDIQVKMHHSKVYLSHSEYSRSVDDLYMSLEDCQVGCDKQNAEEELKLKDMQS